MLRLGVKEEKRMEVMMLNIIQRRALWRFYWRYGIIVDSFLIALFLYFVSSGILMLWEAKHGI